MLRPSALLVLAALAGGCSSGSTPAPPSPVTLRVAEETLELPGGRLAAVRLRPDLDSLIVDGGGDERVLHLVLLAPDREGLAFTYRRPPELPPEAAGDSWLRLDGRWLEAAEVRAEVDRSDPALVRLKLRGTFLEEGRPVPVEGELAVRAPRKR